MAEPDYTRIMGRGHGSYNPLQGRPGSRPARSWESGDNYGSGPGGLPVRRMMRDGRPAGYEIQWQDEWMPMDQFNDPTFQQAFFQPWMQQRGAAEGARFAGENPGFRGAIPGRNFGGRVGSYAGGRGRPVRSGSSGGGGGMGGYDPAMIEALLAGG